MAARSPGDESVKAQLVDSTGALRVSNSGDGQAILSAAGMRPGDTATGTVTIANQSDGAAAFALDPADRTEVAGRGGGRLAAALRLVVRDLGSSQVVYSGTLVALSKATLGTWSAGESHTYRFDVTLPAGHPGANALQGATTGITFRWSAQAAATPPPSTTTTTDPVIPPPSGGDPGGGQTTTTTTPPPPADTRPPVLRLIAGKPQKLRRGSVTFKARCDEDCRLVAASARGAKLKAPSLIRAGSVVRVSVKLSKKDAKKLATTVKKRRKAALKLSLTAADMAGNRGSARAKIVLKR